MTGALDGLLVIECCEGIAGPFAGRLLAGLGAEVVKLERPKTGDATRTMRPRTGDDQQDNSVLFSTLNCGKRGVTLDVDRDAGRELLGRLLRKADVFIGGDASFLSVTGIDVGDGVVTINRRLVCALVTPFGCSGPGRHRKMHDGNIAHASGQSWLLRDEHADGVPLNPGGRVAAYDCGVVVSIAILAAIYERETSGKGQLVDVSMQEAAMAMERVTLGRAATQRALDLPPDAAPFETPLYRCQDGYIVILPAEDSQWRALVELMENPPWAHDERFSTSVGRARHTREIAEHVGAWAATFAKEDLYHRCQRHGVPAGAVRDIAGVVGDAQHAARGFFATIEDPALGTYVVPTGAAVSTETPPSLPAPAPGLGEHNHEIFGGLLGLSSDELVVLGAQGVV